MIEIARWSYVVLLLPFMLLGFLVHHCWIGCKIGWAVQGELRDWLANPTPGR